MRKYPLLPTTLFEFQFCRLGPHINRLVRQLHEFIEISGRLSSGSGDEPVITSTVLLTVAFLHPPISGSWRLLVMTVRKSPKKIDDCVRPRARKPSDKMRDLLIPLQKPISCNISKCIQYAFAAVPLRAVCFAIPISMIRCSALHDLRSARFSLSPASRTVWLKNVHEV